MKSEWGRRFGHSIKNIHIKHFGIVKRGIYMYLCSQCFHATPEKTVFKKDQVTCKNCLRELKKNDIEII